MNESHIISNEATVCDALVPFTLLRNAEDFIQPRIFPNFCLRRNNFCRDYSNFFAHGKTILFRSTVCELLRRKVKLLSKWRNTILGEPMDGLQFFELLYGNEHFCAELGRTVLAAGRLESALKRYLVSVMPAKDTNATLGRLIQFCRKSQRLIKMVPVLEELRDQRNYLTHNIHALLSDLIGETILERANLLDSDVVTYTERAVELRNNLNALADIIERERV